MSGPNCAGTDTDTWFSTRPDDVTACRRICAACPLREQCLAGAVARDEQWGIWGGRVFLPRWISAHVGWYPDAGWTVTGRTAIRTGVFGGGFASQAEAEAFAAAALADNGRRVRAAAKARKSLRGRHGFVGTDAA